MLEQKLNALFEASGYRKFRMSKFEEYDLYAENRDFLKSSQIITFTDLDGSLLALKPDITLSIIKNNRGQDEKVYYNEMVYRPKNHHYCEIPQTGIECIGSIHPYEEAEVISLAAHALACITHTYALQISDAAYLPFLLKQAEVPEYLGDVYEMQNVRFTCQDCPMFKPILNKDGTPNLRVKYGKCQYADFGRTYKDSRCCDMLYTLLRNGTVQLVVADLED